MPQDRKTPSLYSIKSEGKHIGNVFAKTSKGWLACSTHWNMKAYWPSKARAVAFLRSVHESYCGR